VECNVILDALGAAKMDRQLVKKMREAGVEVCFFRPPKPYAVKRLQHRTHRKLLIVDGTTGFTGGVGIAEEWTGNAQDPDHWRDTHVRVRGPVVRGLQGAFAENWLECTGSVLAGDRYLPYIEEIADGGAMQVMRSSATIGDTNAEALVYLALAAAKESIELTSAYFVPRPAFTHALVEAAERGVALRILVPGSHIDKEFVRTAGRAAYDELIQAGIELYEYCPTMLHAKCLTVDECWASVGSVNFDNRSFQLHDEVSLCVQSERFAGLLHDQFERDLDVSERIDPEKWADRPASQRARERVTKYARREL
jgi:cardiolipin synthase